MVKPEGQQCIFDVFLTKPVIIGGGGVERHQREYPHPHPDKSNPGIYSNRFADFSIEFFVSYTKNDTQLVRFNCF